MESENRDALREKEAVEALKHTWLSSVLDRLVKRGNDRWRGNGMFSPYYSGRCTYLQINPDGNILRPEI